MNSELTGTQAHHPKRRQHDPQPRLPHHLAEHELVRHQLDQACVDQDAGGDGVEHSVDDQRCLASGRVRVPHPETDGQRDGRAEGIREPHPIWGVASALRPRCGRQARSQSQAFEGLVEDEDDIQGCEFGAGDGESEADEDGVEDDAEFEDEDRGHLGRKVLGGFVLVDFEVVVDVLPRMPQVIIPGCVSARLRSGADRKRKGGRCSGRIVMRVARTARTMRMSIVVFVGMTEGRVSHRHQFGEEEDKDGHQRDTLGPVVLRYGSREAWICKSFTCRCEQLDGLAFGIFVVLDWATMYPVYGLTCMNAVAMITPDPKYLAMKNAHCGTFNP